MWNQKKYLDNYINVCQVLPSVGKKGIFQTDRNSGEQNP